MKEKNKRFIDADIVLSFLKETRQEQELLSIQAQKERKNVKVGIYDAHCEFCDYLSNFIETFVEKEE